MNRSGIRFDATGQPTLAPAGRADTWMRATVTVTVAGLASIAGAISYSHMRNLAAAHGETGWQAHAFPLSVDGIEIVASLVLLADRRVGRHPGGCHGPRWPPGPWRAWPPTWPPQVPT